MKIIRDSFVAGEPVKPGQTVDVSEADGRNLIAGGKAVPVDKTPQQAALDRAVAGDDASTRG